MTTFTFTNAVLGVCTYSVPAERVDATREAFDLLGVSATESPSAVSA